MSSNTTTAEDETSETSKAMTTAVGATAAQLQTCDGYVSSALTGNTTIQFLIHQLERMGCAPPPGFIQCQNCQGKPVSGGFGMLQEEEVLLTTGGGSGDNLNHHDKIETNSKPKKRNTPDCTRSAADIIDAFQKDKEGKIRLSLQPEIYLCAEHTTGPQHAHTILAHELIHAIDVCRTKNMDPLRNCLQLACTEIRAENLSGECNLQWELMRAKLNGYMGHGQSCVRRRAIDSVRANPNCSAKAALYVDAAMERCYADTFPFERHPNQR